jgi:hypothetical protein
MAYHSETLADAKLKYNTYDKEFYALVWGLKQWRHYILSPKFRCGTFSNGPLTYNYFI